MPKALRHEGKSWRGRWWTEGSFRVSNEGERRRTGTTGGRWETLSLPFVPSWLNACGLTPSQIGIPVIVASKTCLPLTRPWVA
jgi:hypothetical protein